MNKTQPKDMTSVTVAPREAEHPSVPIERQVLGQAEGRLLDGRPRSVAEAGALRRLETDVERALALEAGRHTEDQEWIDEATDPSR